MSGAISDIFLELELFFEFFFIFKNQMYLHKGHIAPRIFGLSLTLTVFKI